MEKELNQKIYKSRLGQKQCICIKRSWYIYTVDYRSNGSVYENKLTQMIFVCNLLGFFINSIMAIRTNFNKSLEKT